MLTSLSHSATHIRQLSMFSDHDLLPGLYLFIFHDLPIGARPPSCLSHCTLSAQLITLFTFRIHYSNISRFHLVIQSHGYFFSYTRQFYRYDKNDDANCNILFIFGLSTSGSVRSGRSQKRILVATLSDGPKMGDCSSRHRMYFEFSVHLG